MGFSGHSLASMRGATTGHTGSPKLRDMLKPFTRGWPITSEFVNYLHTSTHGVTFTFCILTLT